MRGPALTVGVVALVLALPSIAHAVDRYSLQGGCYALQDSSGAPIAGGEQIRLQATTLGRYLFYRPDSTYLASQADGSFTPADAPSPAADFIVEDAANGPGRSAERDAPRVSAAAPLQHAWPDSTWQARC